MPLPALRRGPAVQELPQAVETCERCGEWLDGHRSDDLPPYVTIMIVGHIVVPIILAIEMGLNPWPLWVYFSVFLPGTLVGMLF